MKYTTRLWYSLWIFERTPGTATAMADVPAGLVIGGVVSEFTIAILTSSIQGALLLVLTPATVGADSAISMGLMVLSIRAAERMAVVQGK
jgi:hypothetical protein